MSVPTTIQSNTVPFKLSGDGVTYKNVVCKRSFNFQGTTSVNSEETDCGVHKGLGANDWSCDFEGVLNTTPDGATEMAAATVIGYWLNQTLVYVKFQTGDGTGDNMYVQGQGYITNFQMNNQVPGLIAFSFTFNGDGNPDITI